MRNNFSSRLTDKDIYNFLMEHYAEDLVGVNPEISGALSGITRNSDGSIEWTKTICLDPENDKFAYAHLEFTNLGCLEYQGEFGSRKTSHRYPTLELPYLEMMSKKFRKSPEYNNLLKSYILGKFKELKDYYQKIQTYLKNNNYEALESTKSFYNNEMKYLEKLCKAVLKISLEELTSAAPSKDQPA